MKLSKLLNRYMKQPETFNPALALTKCIASKGFIWFKYSPHVNWIELYVSGKKWEQRSGKKDMFNLKDTESRSFRFKLDDRQFINSIGQKEETLQFIKALEEAGL